MMGWLKRMFGREKGQAEEPVITPEMTAIDQRLDAALGRLNEHAAKVERKLYDDRMRNERTFPRRKGTAHT